MNFRAAVGRLLRSGSGDEKGARRELLHYFAASLVALLVDLGIFSVTIRLLGVPWFWAATLGFAVGVATVYWFSIRWVFSSRRMKHAPRSEFLVFIGIGVAGLCVTQAVLWAGIEGLHAQPELVKVAAAGATFLFNYAVRKMLLFRKSEGTWP